MAKNDKPQIPNARLRVENALKATIESELARQQLQLAGDGGGTPFSRGVIFSKTSPFSRGIIFSRTASDIQERPDEGEMLGQMAAMDDGAFHAFADRLIKMKQTKSS